VRNYAEISDGELLQLLRQEEDALAFGEIYNRYWDKLYGAAYKRVKVIEVAEELVQDCFTDIWVRRKSIDIKVLLPVYLFTAIRYKVINYVHREIVKHNYEHALQLHGMEYDNSTEELLIASDLNNRLQTQVELLPVKCREVFKLSRNEHKSNKEIAQNLGISEKTVENHITLALRRLRTSLNSFFFLF
jgi:RNA polymerase sigma-70 factor (ECF subfamily)